MRFLGGLRVLRLQETPSHIERKEGGNGQGGGSARPHLRYRGRIFDIGSHLGWIVANTELALRRGDIGPGLKEYIQNMDSRE